MKQSVLDALNRVASISAETAKLVEQVKPASPENSEQIERLKKTIIRLTNEVSLLRMESLHNTEPLSDAEVVEFSQSFLEYLSKAEDIKTTLLGYNRAFFTQHSQPVRVVIATTLLNYCTKNNLTASDLWSDIVANMGYL